MFNLMCLISSYWKLCGMFSIQLDYNRSQIVFTLLVLITCLLSIAITPWSICMLDGWCDDEMSTALRRLYTRVLACTSLLSRLTLTYKVKRNLTKYKERSDAYEESWPISDDYLKRFRTYSYLMITLMAIIFPINFMRLYLMYKYEPESDVTYLIVFFLCAYIQNWSMCCMETHFLLLCFSVHLKLCDINQALEILKTKIMINNRYPIVLRSTRATVLCQRTSTERCIDNLQIAYTAEQLRTRHAFARDAISDLNNLFGIQLGLSLCALSVMTLFDIYNESFHMSGTLSRSKLIYGWLLQYILRYILITITAHYTTKEALKTKMIITDADHRNLDKNTKYELQLFLMQINNHSLNFKAFDCVILNTHLITSTITVGITYLFILIQFHSNMA
ncbi:uncharacterized protein LOC126838775 isoform X1 [Adelges cooleyi]|uniref:uncharacterized protein LOC126838775 isoform X1 n=1 Tax=Adelges cooleyi TaxID=133065 RepID=UPI00217F3C7F|nr:uncharacterized protein LOC126838775 isoform X1 [Adelges cooleyi]